MVFIIYQQKASDMLYRTFGKTGIQVSVIGLGTWNIGNQWGEIDDVTAWATIQSAYENGVTLFDTAESYGTPNGLSESRLGEALAGKRHKVTIVSKIGNWGKRTGEGVPKTSVDMIRLCGHAQLHRLQTDWLDVVLCHEANIEDPSIYLEGFEALKAEGKIRYYGISTNSLDVLKNFNRNGTCSVVQTDYSLLNRAPESEFLPYCQENNIGVMIRGPLAKGMLSGQYDESSVFTDDVRTPWNVGGPQHEAYLEMVAKTNLVRERLPEGSSMIDTAIRYVISNPAVSVAIPGAKSPKQAAMNAAAGDSVLSEAECANLQV